MIPPQRGASGFVVCCRDKRVEKWFAVKICNRDLFETVNIGGRLVAGKASVLSLLVTPRVLSGVPCSRALFACV